MVRAVLLLMAASVLMGSGCPTGRNDRYYCSHWNYPLCRDVPSSYECLCLSEPYGTSRKDAELMRNEDVR